MNIAASQLVSRAIILVQLLVVCIGAKIDFQVSLRVSRNDPYSFEPVVSRADIGKYASECHSRALWNLPFMAR